MSSKHSGFLASLLFLVPSGVALAGPGGLAGVGMIQAALPILLFACLETFFGSMALAFGARRFVPRGFAAFSILTLVWLVFGGADRFYALPILVSLLISVPALALGKLVESSFRQEFGMAAARVVFPLLAVLSLSAPVGVALIFSGR